MSVLMMLMVAVFTAGVLQAKDAESPRGSAGTLSVSGNIFKVDLANRRFELLKETAYDPKTDLEKSRVTVYWTEQTVITKVTEQTSFAGIKGPVMTDFHGIDDKNVKALSEGKPFEARVAIVLQSAKTAAGVATDGRQIVSWFTPDEGKTPTSGVIEVDGKPVKVSLRKRNARLYVHAPLSPAELSTGFWKATLQGADVDGRFVISSMEVSPLVDPRTIDDPKLPRVLVIGDSISMNYHEAAKAALKGVANYHRNEGNSFSTIFGVMNAELWLGDYHEKGLGWDVIQFNHGLHDLKQAYHATNDTWGAYAVSLADYKTNLEKEIAILKKTGAKLIWCSTTPVPNSNKGPYARRKGAEEAFNQAALEVMRSHPEIQINDLHQVVTDLPLFDDWRKTIDVHFYKEAEQKKLGDTVAEAIRKALHRSPVAGLRCEYLAEPLGIDTLKPRLSWKIVISDQSSVISDQLSVMRGVRQAAYQVLVASSDELLKQDEGDLWDSGKVESDQSVNVEYAGKPLVSNQRCFWKVKVWTASATESGVLSPESKKSSTLLVSRSFSKGGTPSSWSDPSLWAMGILKSADWGSAKWIKSDLELYDYQKELKKLVDHDREAEAPMWARAKSIMRMTADIHEAPAVWLRKEFSASGKPLRSVRAFVSGLGYYELYINGKKVNDQYINVAPYDYDKAVPYQVHDVTQHLRGGRNAIGVILGNGYFNPVVPSLLREYAADFIDTPRLLLKMTLEYEDGSVERVVSDETWKFTTAGPIRFNSVRAGETYDARMELGDWSSPDYSIESWKNVIVAEAPTGVLVNQDLPPVRRIAEIPAVSVIKNKEGYRFDIGVEATGWARLKVRGKPGQKITVKYPGKVSHTLGRYQECQYICRGGGEEMYEPRFAFNGYRFVDVSGLDYEPKPSDLVGCEVVCDLKRVGQFSCSSSELNKIQEVILRTILNYNIQIPMDPVREKVGWTQDVQSNFKATACNFDVSRIYQKWQEDFVLSIQADGYVPTVVPGCFDGPTINGPWWGGMIVYNPWQFYNFYGDRRILERSYEPMKHYISYLDSIATNNIISWGLGDWMDTTPDCKQGSRPNCTTVPFTSTCAYMMYHDMVRKTALLLGKNEDAARYATRVEEIRAALNSRFLNKSTGVYDKGSQTGHVLALVLGVPEEADRPRVTENLKAQIASDGFHVTSGFVGIPILLTYLTEHGMGDLAWRIATRPTYPGWFDMIFTLKNSVLKEDWAGRKVQMPSLASPIGEWFYRCLGGIRPDTPGFKHFVIQPYTETLDWVKCEYESPYGVIQSDWSKKDGVLAMELIVPPNTTATVYIPAKDEAGVTESGKPASQSDGIKFLRMENGAAVYEVGSGVYTFISKLESQSCESL